MMNFLCEDSRVMIAGQCALVYLSVKFILKLVTLIWKRFLVSPINIKRKYGGKWALVTGSTDGIGQAYAFALAKCNMNIILVSRTQSKLDSTASKIVERYPSVQTKTIAIDFVNDEETSYRLKVAREIEDLEIAVLINNVGLSYAFPAPFLEIEGGTNEVSSDLVKCNITSVNTMTAMVLPQMVERKSGVIINISSLSGLMPTPLLSVYSASKAYVDIFTRGLCDEYKNFGIVVQSVAPGYVVSKLSKIRKPTLIAPSPDIFVKSALSTLGIESRTTGFWLHDLMVYVTTEVLPEWLATKITHDSLKGIRKSALKKKAKAQ